SPTVASTYSPPGFIASQWIVSSTSTGVCCASKLDAQAVQSFPVVVRDLALLQVLQRPGVIPNFQIGQVAVHVHFAFHQRGFPKYRWNQDSSLPVDFNRLTVIVRPGQELLLGPVVRREPGKLRFNLFPNLHRVNPGRFTGFARDVELIAKAFELFQKCRGNLETTLLVHFCWY